MMHRSQVLLGSSWAGSSDGQVAVATCVSMLPTCLAPLSYFPAQARSAVTLSCPQCPRSANPHWAFPLSFPAPIPVCQAPVPTSEAKRGPCLGCKARDCWSHPAVMQSSGSFTPPHGIVPGQGLWLSVDPAQELVSGQQLEEE
jgi:hypothetical protein